MSDDSDRVVAGPAVAALGVDWPEGEYLVHGSGAFVRANLKPCACCSNAIFEIVERPNGSTWLECPDCCQKYGKRNGRLLGKIDMAKRVLCE